MGHLNVEEGQAGPSGQNVNGSGSVFAPTSIPKTMIFDENGVSPISLGKPGFVNHLSPVIIDFLHVLLKNEGPSVKNKFRTL